MKVIVAGSRGIDNIHKVAKAIENSRFEITEVVSGTCRGVDQLGERWARHHGISIARFPADWNRYGRSAGFRRNIEMARYADALVAVWDGESRGTKHMIQEARAQDLKVYIHIKPTE